MEKLKEIINSILSFERAIPMVAFILALLTTIAYLRVKSWDDFILLLGITLIAYSWAYP